MFFFYYSQILEKDKANKLGEDEKDDEKIRINANERSNTSRKGCC